MSVKKTIIRSSIVLVFALMLVTAIIFLMASAVPANYQPRQYTKKEREDAASRLVQRSIELSNKYQELEPFLHVVKESEINGYVASLEEIAYNKPNREKGAPEPKTVTGVMDDAGIADPWVHLGNDRLTLMVRTVDLMKVVSLELSFTFPDEEHFMVNLEGISIGRMPVPRYIIDGGLSVLKDNLPEAENVDSLSFQDFDFLLAKIIRGIDGQPISTTLNIRKRKRRINRIEISEGELRIEFVPSKEDLERAKKAQSATTRPAS